MPLFITPMQIGPKTSHVGLGLGAAVQSQAGLIPHQGRSQCCSPVSLGLQRSKYLTDPGMSLAPAFLWARRRWALSWEEPGSEAQGICSVSQGGFSLEVVWVGSGTRKMVQGTEPVQGPKFIAPLTCCPSPAPWRMVRTLLSLSTAGSNPER